MAQHEQAAVSLQCRTARRKVLFRKEREGEKTSAFRREREQWRRGLANRYPCFRTSANRVVRERCEEVLWLVDSTSEGEIAEKLVIKKKATEMGKVTIKLGEREVFRKLERMKGGGPSVSYNRLQQAERCAKQKRQCSVQALCGNWT